MQRPNLAARPFEDRRPVWLTAAALGAAALALSFASIGEFVSAHGAERSLTERLTRLEKRRKELGATVDSTNRELQRVNWSQLRLESESLGKAFAGRSFSWSELLLDLERVLPWDTRLTSVAPRLREDGEVEIALVGLAAGRDGWLRLLARLFADKKFSNPMPLSEEAPASTGGLGYKFQLRVRYWPEGRP